MPHDILRIYLLELVTDTVVVSNIIDISIKPYLRLLSLLIISVTFPNSIGLSYLNNTVDCPLSISTDDLSDLIEASVYYI